MDVKAVIMGILGILLLWGGLSYCIGIAWYHSKKEEEDSQKDE